MSSSPPTAVLTFKGVTFNHTRYVVTSSGLKPIEHASEGAPWRLCYNGNPRGMLRVIKEALPAGTNVLFIVQRDLNRNVAVYAYDEHRAAVHAFWFMIPAGARRASARLDEDREEDEEVDVGDATTEELTFVEQSMAYGVTPLTPGNVFRIRALEGRDMTVVRAGNEWAASTVVEGKSMLLREVFICTEASTWRPWPTTTECHLTCVETADKAPVTYHYSVSL